MKKQLRWVAVGAAFLGMGISMPSCPGQQAMQQQIDQLQTSTSEANKKVQGMDNRVKALESDNKQMKELLDQMTKTIQAQKAGLEQLDAWAKDMQAKMAAKPAAKAPAKKPAPKPAPKKHK